LGAAVVADMVTLLITSVLVLAFVAVAIYFWQKPPSSTEVAVQLPPPARGLFIDGTPAGQAASLAEAATDSAVITNAVRRHDLVERMKAGERSALLETWKTGDSELYNEGLNLLVTGADSDPKLLSLVSYVTRHELPVNRKLAERFIDCYKRSADRSSTAKVLHVAALSDDAAVYQNAVETALMLWRTGTLTDMSATELRSILDGEFWILSSPTRSSGAGFLLKRALNGARRELEAAHND
jgi:hypothetical protein